MSSINNTFTIIPNITSYDETHIKLLLDSPNILALNTDNSLLYKIDLSSGSILEEPITVDVLKVKNIAIDNSNNSVIYAATPYFISSVNKYTGHIIDNSLCDYLPNYINNGFAYNDSNFYLLGKTMLYSYNRDCINDISGSPIVSRPSLIDKWTPTLDMYLKCKPDISWNVIPNDQPEKTYIANSLVVDENYIYITVEDVTDKQEIRNNYEHLFPNSDFVCDTNNYSEIARISNDIMNEYKYASSFICRINKDTNVIEPTWGKNLLAPYDLKIKDNYIYIVSKMGGITVIDKLTGRIIKKSLLYGLCIGIQELVVTDKDIYLYNNMSKNIVKIENAFI